MCFQVQFPNQVIKIQLGWLSAQNVITIDENVDENVYPWQKMRMQYLFSR